MRYFLAALSIAALGYGGYVGLTHMSAARYVSGVETRAQVSDASFAQSAASVINEVPVKEVATHIETPAQVKAVYMTSWVAGTSSIKNKLLASIEGTEINSIVVDIKDYTGKVAFDTGSEELKKYNSTENRIRDIRALTKELHDKNLYIIGRIAVFQDSHLIKEHPEWAVKTLSDKNKIWRDHKGIAWLDANEEEVWKYIALIAKESYDAGFDEINFDYIRFPSDGNMKDIYFPKSDGLAKTEVMKKFYAYTDEHVRKQGIPTSADLFGMVTTVTTDLNIGQVLEDALPYFDFIAPMVYPSHFPATWNGYSNPAAKPYEVIHKSMGSAVERTKAISLDPKKLRPWLQDFNLGATYTKEMVRDQIRATYDVGLDSWMLWDPANTYTVDALEAKSATAQLD